MSKGSLALLPGGMWLQAVSKAASSRPVQRGRKDMGAPCVAEEKLCYAAQYVKSSFCIIFIFMIAFYRYKRLRVINYDDFRGYTAVFPKMA